MKSSVIFFISSLFFIIGVFLKSVGFSSFIFFGVLILLSLFFILGITRSKKFIILSFLTFFILIGALYYTSHDLHFQNSKPVFGKKMTFSGIVVSNPVEKKGSVNFQIKLKNKSKILVKVSKYPVFNYGDKLNLSGIIQIPEIESYRNYLAKDNISGVMYYPDVSFIDSGFGSPVKSFLLSFKNEIHDSFKQLLPPLQAAFLNGITLGGYEGFTEKFKEAMSLTGTTHLVALSGYNIIIIIVVFSSIFLSVFSKRNSYILTVLFIVGFVLMTGAESSVVRAAIMGILVLIASQSGRVYDIKNSIILTAIIMIIINPKVLVFDVGFQLSFLAVIGILYLKDPLQKILKMDKKPGFLSWRENLLTTTSAQLAVIPILISNFGVFSPISLLTNTVILELIPITMFFGFLIALVSFISYPFSLILAWFTGILLYIETGFINLFAKIGIPLNFNFGIIGIILYYSIFVFLINKFKTYA